MKFYQEHTREEVCQAIVMELLAGTECSDKDWIYANTIEEVRKYDDEELLSWASWNL